VSLKKQETCVTEFEYYKMACPSGLFCDPGFRCAVMPNGERCLTEQEYARIFGEPITQVGAEIAMNYALMANDAYENEQSKHLPPGVRRIRDWEDVMRANGVSEADLRAIRKSGFYAAVYKNDKTGEVTIAYRGTVGADDWGTNFRARFVTPLSKVPLQYRAAGELAGMVRSEYSRNISLTGHSLGGSLASYAGIEAHIPQVITFNAARTVYSTNHENPGQKNIIVAGDVVGDPVTGTNIAGYDALPGQLLTVQSVTNTSSASGIYYGHRMDGIIGGLQNTIAGRNDETE
jgi:hypothetical protein